MPTPTILQPQSGEPCANWERISTMRGSGGGFQCRWWPSALSTSRSTLQRVEGGDTNVSIGIYAGALQALGLLDGLG